MVLSSFERTRKRCAYFDDTDSIGRNRKRISFPRINRPSSSWGVSTSKTINGTMTTKSVEAKSDKSTTSLVPKTPSPGLPQQKLKAKFPTTTLMPKVVIDELTLKAMELETEVLNFPVSIHDLSIALSESTNVSIHHCYSPETYEDNESQNPSMNKTMSGITSNFHDLHLNGWNGDGSEIDERHKKKQKEEKLKMALNRLTTSVGSLEIMVHNWEEAKAHLAKELILPGYNGEAIQKFDESTKNGTDQKWKSPVRKGYSETAFIKKSTPIRSSSRFFSKGKRDFPSGRNYKGHENSVKRYMDRIMRFTLKRGFNWSSKLEQIKATTSPPPIVRQVEKESEENKIVKEKDLLPDKIITVKAPSAMDRLDRLLQNRVDDAERRARSKQKAINDRIEADIVRREEKQKQEQEARDMTSSLLRPLTDDEQEVVKNAIYGIGPSDSILASSDTDSVQRESMQRLQPGRWLNDEIIHYFYLMLTNRDAEMCTKEPGRKRSHFFKSFFLTKLFDEGASSEYRYANVKRWSKRVPGKDLFNLEKIFFPCNMGNVHWACVVIFMTQKRIQFYDSMGGDGMHYMNGLMRYLKDEWAAKKGGVMPDAESWKLIPSTSDTPCQENSFDCGVFTCMYADFLSKDCPLIFSQEHITQCRERIALSIMKGSAIH